MHSNDFKRLELLGTHGPDVAVVPYTLEWPVLYELEAQRIRAACAAVSKIEHIGSTSIPGLFAKPILDIMPGVVRHADGNDMIEPMKSLGYVYHGELGIAGRYFFTLNVSGRRVVNTHVFEMGCGEWERHLRFRDYMRNHGEAAQAYQALKIDLAERCKSDRDAYQDGKNDFIKRIDALASLSP